MLPSDWRFQTVRELQENRSRELLKPLRRGVVHDQVLKDRKDMPAIADDAFEQWTQRRLSPRLAIPLGEYGGGDFDIATQLLGRVAAEEQAVKESGLSLRELKILQRFVQRVGLCSHCRKPQFTDFDAAVKSPRDLRGNKLLETVALEVGKRPIKCPDHSTLRKRLRGRAGTRRARQIKPLPLALSGASAAYFFACA